MRGFVRDHFSGIHHQHAVSQQQSFRHVVSDHHRSQAEFAMQGADPVAERVARDRIECAEGFVHQQQARFIGQCARHTDPLALPARQFVGQPVCHFGFEIDQFEQAGNPFARQPFADQPRADGARYTTYLDQDGTYRDLRNGDPWQTGSWRYSEEEGNGKRLCLRPDDENGVERCWEPDRMRNGVMRAENDAGTVIELESVTYALPVETADEAA